MNRHHTSTVMKYLSYLSALLLALVMFGCGDRGERGENGISTGTISGQVTDTGGNKLAGITVSAAPTAAGISGSTGTDVSGTTFSNLSTSGTSGTSGTTSSAFASTTTDTNGNYTLTVPGGNWTVTFTRPGYAGKALLATVITAQTTTLNATLTQTAAAVVNVANTQFNSNGTATLTATALVNQPSLMGQPVTFTWTDANGNVIGTGPTITVNRPATSVFAANAAALAAARFGLEAPGENEQADENSIDVANLQLLDRFQVVPITLGNFQRAALTTVHVTGTINGQTFTAAPAPTVSAATNGLPFVPNPGLRDVPLGQPVLLQGRTNLAAGGAQTSWNWTMTPPAGSTAILVDASTQFPHFVPDVAGVYAITETVSGLTMNIYAGNFVGVFVPGATPGGTVDTTCSQAGAGASSCHAGATFFNTPYNSGAQFFDTNPVNTVFAIWSSSGHAHAFLNGLNSGSSFNFAQSAAFTTVGFSQFSGAGAKIHNGGFSDVAGATGFTSATAQANAPNFFNGFPQALRVSGVQCESCHGPNGVAHATGNPDTISSRFSIASDVCGTCHFSRYSEWAGSGHGDFETATDEGMQGGTHIGQICGGCHTGQGFPLLLAQLEGGLPLRTLTGTASPPTLNFALVQPITPQTVQPQTCAVCHDVHNPGTHNPLTGFVVILRGDFQQGGTFAGTTPLLPGGFAANGVGKGALCIVCHNSRNGGVATNASNTAGTATLHEDGDINFGRPTSYTAGGGVPHEACQGDVLMGRNAFFFSSFSTARGREDITLPGFSRVIQPGQRSAHSFIADTCVTCHMELSHAAGANATSDFPQGIQNGGTNHTFAIANNPARSEASQINALCTNCHGASFVGTGVQDSFDAAYNTMLQAIANAVLRLKFGSAGAIPSGTTLVFIPGRTPAVSLNGATSVSLSSFLASAPGTANTGPLPASGFERDLAKANWNAGLVAPDYTATFGGTRYDNGTPITAGAGLTSIVVGDQSKGIHNPSFIFEVMSVTTQRMNAL